MPPIFVSFYTAGTPYEAEAAELVRTLESHRLQFDVRAVPNAGSWVRNCAEKARFIRDRIVEHDGRPVVWVDADARIQRRPDLLFDLDCWDFAAHWKDGWELLSGTLYFGPTPAALALAEAWVKGCEADPEQWDQRTLQTCVQQRLACGLRVRRLPPAYCQIFDSMADAGEPVIEHFQASRRLRGLVAR